MIRTIAWTITRSLPLALGLTVCCGSSSPEAPRSSPEATPDPALDADGVRRLYPSAPGSTFRLGGQDPNATDRFLIEKATVATPHASGALHYWNLPSYALNYSSGGSGWTSRLHIHASGGAQLYTWQTQNGFLSSAMDLKNQEFTAYVRVHQILDAPRAQLTLKIRGGSHSSGNPELSSCVMMTFAQAGQARNARFGKELTHPDYDYVNLSPAFSAGLVENTWVGLKLVSWNDRQVPTRVVNRLYIDPDPFDANGKPKNTWRLFSEYIDVEGLSTGQYSKLVNWGGWQTTLRTDGFRDIDFALISVREISPP